MFRNENIEYLKSGLSVSSFLQSDFCCAVVCHLLPECFSSANGGEGTEIDG